MADILKISDATALALHTMVHLALDPKKQSTTTEIAAIFKVSKHHLAKVHQRLAKAGLIKSHRGPSGGVSLAKQPKDVTMLDIYETIEGTMHCNPCLFDNEECPRCDCVLGELLPRLALQVKSYFKETTLEELVKLSNWREEQ